MVHKAAVLSLDFSKTLGGEKLLLASGDSLGFIKVWKVQSGKCLREFELGIGAKGGISSLKFT
jgi:WD40 repeat protein